MSVQETDKEHQESLNSDLLQVLSISNNLLLHFLIFFLGRGYSLSVELERMDLTI